MQTSHKHITADHHNFSRLQTAYSVPTEYTALHFTYLHSNKLTCLERLELVNKGNDLLQGNIILLKFIPLAKAPLVSPDKWESSSK